MVAPEQEYGSAQVQEEDGILFVESSHAPDFQASATSPKDPGQDG